MIPFRRPEQTPVQPETDPMRVYLQAISRGDTAAFQTLYQMTSKRTYCLAFRILENHQDAEEVVSDTYWQVWRSAAAFNGTRGTVQTWLAIIVRTRALDRLRARTARERLELELDAPDDLAQEAAPRLPEQQALAAQERTALYEAVACLPGDIRTLVELAFFVEMSHAQIARHLNQPLGTVKTKIRRGLQLMRGALRPYSAGWIRQVLPAPENDWNGCRSRTSGLA